MKFYKAVSFLFKFLFFAICSNNDDNNINNNDNNNNIIINNNKWGWNVDLCQSGNEINIFVEKIRSTRLTGMKLGRFKYFSELDKAKHIYK
jgi:hypothetical protein